MTTNHPEKLDPALLRHGRIDLRERIDKLGPVEVASMCARFFDEPRARSFAQTVVTPMAAADLQEQLIRASEGAPSRIRLAG